MCTLPFRSDDLAVWSGRSLQHDGYEQFAFGFGYSPEAEMQQAVMAQNGQVLSARSGICLVIPVYVAKHRLGLLVHLARELSLSEEAAWLITAPFDAFAELRENPVVGFVSSVAAAQDCGAQIFSARELIAARSPKVVFRDIITASGKNDDMHVDVFVDTKNGQVHAFDDYGTDQLLDFSK